MRYYYLLFFSFIFNQVFSQNKPLISTSELIVNSTIRIEGSGEEIIDGQQMHFTSTGTGFYFEFKFDSITIPVIVTNYHVIENTNSQILRFTEKNSDGTPAYGKKITEYIDTFSSKWIKHPSEDLAILPLNPILNNIKKTKNKDVFVVNYDESLIPSKESLNELNSIEDVLMIGYPEGFWDSTNNLPIVRKGITATPLQLDYNGHSQFLLDIPVFPGSSGSPIVLSNQGSYSGKRGGMTVGSRLFLLGIIVQSINYNAEGKLIYPGNTIKTATQLPFNVGVVIKSQELLKFRPILQKLLDQYLSSPPAKK